MANQNVIIKKIFENRDYTEEYLSSINNPEHSQLKDVDVLASELKEIHDSGHSITIYPDFDTDGVSSGACLYAGLAELGFNVNLYIPKPRDGYGISSYTVKELLNCYPDTYAIITCDTGITGGDAVDYCKQAGIKIFVTDHHKQKTVHNADVIVDPMRVDETYEHPYICGSFVAYQVLLRYAELYDSNFEVEQIKLLRVFAGIGTVSDTMPLLYENRQIVRDAINICKYIYGDGSSLIVKRIRGRSPYVQAFWGLYSILCFYAKIGVLHSSDDINEDFFAFYLSPAINSAKRLDGDMCKVFGIFFARSLSNLEDNINYIYTLNNERKTAVAVAFHNMLESDQPYAPYIYFSDAIPGILGLLAQKIMEKTGQPAFVITTNSVCGDYEYTGSGRSPAWYPCITRAGHKAIIEGHEGAFGCRFKDRDNVEDFYNFLVEDVRAIPELQSDREPFFDFVISPDWTGDVGIDIAVFSEYLTEINAYRPFGRGFSKPVGKLVFNNDDVVIPDGKDSGWETMGRAHEHLKIHLSHGFDIVCWNQGHLIKQKDLSYTHEIIGDLRYSEFKGVTSIIFDGVLVER